MADIITGDFLRKSTKRALALAAGNPRLQIMPEAGDVPQKFVVQFNCRGLVRDAGRGIIEADRFMIGIRFDDDYLRGKPNTFKVLSFLGPLNIWHPNIKAPYICVGDMRPGSDLTAFIHQVYEIITYQKFATQDALNHEASEWARNNLSRFPTDSAPLRQRVAVEFEEVKNVKRLAREVR